LSVSVSAAMRMTLPQPLRPSVSFPGVAVPNKSDQAKARLAKQFVAAREEFKAALFSIMLSIQRTTDLILSFFRLPGTKYAAHGL
jgi:hypothetical protein